MHVTCVSNPHPDLVREIARRLEVFNRNSMRGATDERVVAVATVAGSMVGGAIGYATWGWLAIDVLWVDKDHRGQDLGRRLVEALEKEGMKRGCHSVHTDTFSFQAPQFYSKLGYEEFGRLEGFVNGQTRFFLRKQLGA